MALNKGILKDNIMSIMNEMLTREGTAIDEFAGRLASAIDNYVKQAEIEYTSGLTSPAGAVTGKFEGKLK